MGEKRNFTDEELMEYLKNNNIRFSYELVSDKNKSIDDVLSDEINPISEYTGLSEKMKIKIEKIIKSLADEKEKKSESDDRDESDTLDEKDGKEQLSEDKKREADERKRQNGESQQEPESQEQENEDAGAKKQEHKVVKKEETPEKDEYLAKLKKLHKMKIVDYRDQMKTGEVDVDRYYMTMLVLQKSLNRQRAAFIKEYGSDELVRLENQYLQEENKYKRTITNNMEAALAKLRALDQKLDEILYEMSTLQQQLQHKSISTEEYNDRINVLEKDKLETLWQINRLNPELIEEQQLNSELREKLERRTTTRTLEKQKAKDMSSLNKQRTSGLKHDIKSQEGVAEQSNDDREKLIKEAIDENERRLDAIRKEVNGLDITTPEGKKRLVELGGEVDVLMASKAALEIQYKNIKNNMSNNIENYGDLKAAEVEREKNVKEYSENVKGTNPEDWSDTFAAQFRDKVSYDPSTPEQAQELLDDIEEITEDAKDEQKTQDDKEKTEDTEPPTLWNRRKRPF